MKYQEPTFMGSDAVYVYMVENFFTHELAFWAAPHEIDRLQQDAAIRHSSMLGEKAKDIQVIDPDGKLISLLDTRAKIIVLYIYTPNCENCQKETPIVKAAYDRWKNKGVEVFALCTDPDEELWKTYIAQNDLDWINAFDPMIESEYTFKYHIDITPELYVLDKNRVIVARDLHAFQLDEILGRHIP
jgi:peroxiredoxin